MLIRFVMFLVVLYLVYRIVKFLRQAKPVGMNNYKFKSTPTVREDLVEDPVCHTYVPVSQAYKKEIAGNTYCFCSKECCEEYILKKSNERQ
jgi:YHS domain-containing protein